MRAGRLSVFLIMAAVIVSLTSCKTFSERRAELAAKRAAADKSQCLAMGFTVNTDAFRLCLDNRNIERAAKAAQFEAQQAKRAAKKAKRAADKAKRDREWDCIMEGTVC
jgi:hypothetical protein